MNQTDYYYSSTCTLKYGIMSFSSFVRGTVEYQTWNYKHTVFLTCWACNLCRRTIRSILYPLGGLAKQKGYFLSFDLFTVRNCLNMVLMRIMLEPSVHLARSGSEIIFRYGREKFINKNFRLGGPRLEAPRPRRSIQIQLQIAYVVIRHQRSKSK